MGKRKPEQDLESGPEAKADETEAQAVTLPPNHTILSPYLPKQNVGQESLSGHLLIRFKKKKKRPENLTSLSLPESQDPPTSEGCLQRVT